MTEHRISLPLYSLGDVLSVKVAICKYCESNGISTSDVIRFYKGIYPREVVI